MKREILATACLLMLPATLQAQAPAQAAPAAEPPPATAQTPAVPQPQAGWSYDPEGRRDPFASLIGRGNEARLTGARPAGVPGLLIADVTVKGILRDRDGFIAMIQSADGKTFIVRTGDRLFDGTVKSIVHDKVVFSQDVNDPLSLVKQREIPKPVRPADAGRGAGPV